jgi:bifunctional UDP-N-acetylglucosamine 2-epimerase / N-acetylmannosamine kinase
MRKKCLVVVVSARASYSRIRSVLLELQKSSKVQVKVVLVASGAMRRYGQIERFLQEDKMTVSWRIESQLDLENSTSMAKTTGLTILGLADYLQNERPDAILVIADRHETIAASICGSYLGIRTFHIQGGERTGNIDDRVRFANSHLSDDHFVTNNSAKNLLEKCGIDGDRIHVTGCPSLDFIEFALEEKNSTFKSLGVGMELEKLEKEEFVIVIQHPETTSELLPEEQISQTVMAIETLGMPALWIWPNSDAGGEEIVRTIRSARERRQLQNVHFRKSFEPKEFIRLLSKSSCVVGNSSVAIRECSFLGIPAVNIGTRQVGRDMADNVVTVDFDASAIVEAVGAQVGRRFPRSLLYGEGNASKKIRVVIEDLLFM